MANENQGLYLRALSNADKNPKRLVRSINFSGL